jgi:23S rRNA (cytosine1962-C5)-methyltransferase
VLAEEKMIMFRNRLSKVYKHLGKQARKQGVTCYRVYDHDLPEFPLCIEFYGDKLYVAEYKRKHGLSDEEHDDWMEASIAAISEILSVSKENIYLKLRQRKAGRLGQYQRLEASHEEFIVEENGLKFIVNLSDYLDTGLFLDHRITRQRVREQSPGKRVLNLFAYTGSFSVYAAAGGAVEVVTVDLSKTYLLWAGRNMALNDFPVNNDVSIKSGNKFIHADVLQFLKELPPDYYDIVVMDPPTFSNSKRMADFLDIQRDHVSLINDCLYCMKSGGMLYFSTNARRFQLDREKLVASGIKDITKATTPFDFEGRQPRWCFVLTK